ncbi:MAG: dihydrodipicolinate synthase family protein [Kiritimatiellae bacterium]|nr:dihydrodipicolinate synthase family protein [Kiritimatiellia bacterium]
MMRLALDGKEFQNMNGAYAAMFTPFTADNRVNPEMIERIIEFGLENGLRGFYLTGSTGEGFLLNEAERKLVMETAVRANKGRGKLIAHVGCLATDDAVTLARYAAEIGIDWVSSVAPVYFGQSFEAAFRHYQRISEATDLPFMVYSIGQALVPERDVRFFDLKNVKGIKYTGRDYYAAQCLKRKLGKEVIFFAGCDEQLLCGLALGNVFSGGIGTTYNIIPNHFAQICALAEKGDFAAAARYQDEANRVVELMIEDENWSTRKAMMRYIGLDCGAYRYPYAPLTEEQYQAFAARFAALGIVERDYAVTR